MSAIEVPKEWFGADNLGTPDETHDYDYDIAVIGGGSGGLAASREAAKLGKRVCVFDFVTPSPYGTTYGLGGTCVCVGCIPKKLMHHAAGIGESIKDAREYGWRVPKVARHGHEASPGKPMVSHDWHKLVGAVQDHIGSLNWGYRTALRSEEVDYINALAKFEDAHTIVGKDRRGREKKVTARRIIVAVGGRPRYPSIPGIDLAISSDDIFKLKREPGKTLCIGASYVSLECAGFLTGLGYDVTVMVRSILLRGFDQQMADKIGEYMETHGTKFQRGFVPTRLEKVEIDPSEAKPGKVKNEWASDDEDADAASDSDSDAEAPYKIRVYFRPAGDESAEEQSEVFDTVFFAVGRDPCTARLEPEKAGLELLKNGKFSGENYERTNVEHIYAVGDCLDGHMELTPVAIQCGRRLVRRLYEPNFNLGLVNKIIPTTVFTPLEYGSVGLSEEAAREEGGDNIDVIHAYYQPLEWSIPHREDNACYVKIIFDKSANDKVLGFHILGPNAGEITQGIAVALGCGAKLRDIQLTIGIHPTTAEEIVTADVTKSSGKDPKRTGC